MLAQAHPNRFANRGRAKARHPISSPAWTGVEKIIATAIKARVTIERDLLCGVSGAWLIIDRMLDNDEMQKRIIRIANYYLHIGAAAQVPPV